MVKLRNYIEKNNLRLVDFFNKFDKDHSMSVTREEFTEGLEVNMHKKFPFRTKNNSLKLFKNQKKKNYEKSYIRKS